jgi:hypothetical protein
MTHWAEAKDLTLVFIANETYSAMSIVGLYDYDCAYKSSHHSRRKSAPKIPTHVLWFTRYVSRTMKAFVIYKLTSFAEHRHVPATQNTWTYRYYEGIFMSLGNCSSNLYTWKASVFVALAAISSVTSGVAVSNTAATDPAIICNKNLGLLTELKLTQKIAETLCPFGYRCFAGNVNLQPDANILGGVAAIFEAVGTGCRNVCKCGTLSNS